MQSNCLRNLRSKPMGDRAQKNKRTDHCKLAQVQWAPCHLLTKMRWYRTPMSHLGDKDGWSGRGQAMNNPVVLVSKLLSECREILPLLSGLGTHLKILECLCGWFWVVSNEVGVYCSTNSSCILSAVSKAACSCSLVYINKQNIICKWSLIKLVLFFLLPTSAQFDSRNETHY